MKDNKKETKVKFEFKLKDTIEKIKTSCSKVKSKIDENIKSGELKKINKQSIKYYSMLFVMLVVAVVATYANIKSYKEVNKEEYKTYVSSNENVEKEEKEDSINTDEGEGETVPVVSTAYETAQSSISYTNNTKSSSLPVEGSIKREYSMDKVVYYESLEVWKTHSGVDIVCEESSPVRSVIDGKIIGIYNDGMYGYSVVVEGEEYTAVYSSLTEDVLVSIGKTVKVGEQIGYAGVSPAEQELEYHLHFEVMKDGEYVNPEVLGIK